MWNFRAEQKVFQIGNIKIGGRPEERPAVLLGSLFYRGHNIVEDEREGLFDKDKAEYLIKTQEDFSDKTGVPAVVDVVGENPKAMVKFLDFVTSVTDSVISVDGTLASVRLAALAHIKEVGIKNPLIYNSLMEPKQDELDKLKELNVVKTAIALCYNPRDYTSKGRVDIAKELIKKAQYAGIENIMIDTMVLDIPTLGMALRALNWIKDELGYPCGCGAHNAVGLWRGAVQKLGKQVMKPANVVATAMAVAAGADFVLYGPIDHADVVLPVIGMMSASYGQLTIEDGKRLPPSHPRFKIA